MDTQPSPSLVLFQLASAHYVSQALYVAAELGIADLLADGPQTYEALAARTATHAPSLRRVLRLLVTAGVFTESEDQRCELTPIGACLRGGPGSFRAVVRLFGGPMVWRSWGGLLDTVRTGEPAFGRVFETDSFRYLADHPDEAAVFDEAMGTFTDLISGAVAAAYPFSSMRSLIDVGGGEGALLTTILRGCPGLRGVVFDLPRLEQTARRHIAADVVDRCQFVGGDFFEAVPAGFDAYLLKHVIHDWDDTHAARILATCRHAMAPEAKLLVVEGVYPPKVDGSPASRGAAANDVNMLVCTGGRQRSEAEFRALYAAAGFRLTRIIPTMAMSCVIEGVKA